MKGGIMEEVTIKESYHLQDNRCLSSLSLFVLSFPKGNEKLFALLSKIVYYFWPNAAREMAAHQVPFCQRQGPHGKQGSQGWILRNRKRQQHTSEVIATMASLPTVAALICKASYQISSFCNAQFLLCKALVFR